MEEETTVLENVTDDKPANMAKQLSSRFSQLWRNLTGSPHKPFNPQTFTSRGLAVFYCWPGAVFAFWWLVRLCGAGRCIAKWANGDGIKTSDRGSWLQLPLTMIAGAFIIDLLLLALTLFVGQLLSGSPEYGQ